jgi:hypothetical protein
MRKIVRVLERKFIDQEHELWFGDCENDVVFELLRELDM